MGVCGKSLAVRRASKSDLLPGESLIACYSHAAAGCSCAFTHFSASVPAMPVARAGRVDRCVRCSTRWVRKAMEFDATVLVTEGADAAA